MAKKVNGRRKSRRSELNTLTDGQMDRLPELLVTSSEAARMLGVTQTAINRYVASGKLKGVKIGDVKMGTVLLRRVDVEEFEVGQSGRPRINF